MNKYNEDSHFEEKAIDYETREEVGGKKPNVKESMLSLIRWAEERRGFKFVNVVKQYSAFKKARSSNISPTKLKDRWLEMEGQRFWIENGLDWTSVVSSFDRKG